MGIRIISEDERLVTKVEGVEFVYSRATPDEIQDASDECTTRGKTDNKEFNAKMLASHIHGWDENLTGADDRPLPFDPRLIRHLIGDVQAELAAAITKTPKGVRQGEKQADPT